jgi:Na+/H+-dicarboxylate symporter
MAAPRAENGKRLWLMGGSIAGLLAGFLLGIWAHRTGEPTMLAIVGALSPIGTLWGNALRMTVVPLVVAQLVCSLVSTRSFGSVGRITSLSFIVFLLMLVLAGTVTVMTTPPVLARLQFSPDALAAFRAAVPVGDRPTAAPPPGFGAWLTGLVPANALRAAVQDDLLGMMIFAIAFGLAVARMPAERRTLVADLFRVLADAMMTIVGWIMWILPVGVFVLALSTAARTGLGAAEVVVTFVVLTCVVLLAWTLLMYPLAALVGGIPIRRFAKAVLPAQLVAVSTRSSIASLPALIDGAQNRLDIRPEVSSLVMPLAVSTFKLNRTISTAVQFLFLAHVSGVGLSVSQVVTFMLAALLLSFSSIGIPSGGLLMRSAPLYLAAGIPIEAYLLVEAVDAVPDIFKTLVNVTGDMTAASLVNRFNSRAENVTARVTESTVAAAGV